MDIEIIVRNKEEAIAAVAMGATRLELIDAYDPDGISPDYEMIREVCEAVSVPVNVMLRPTNSESFVYDEKERAKIFADLDFILEKTKAAGIVFGALTKEKELDLTLLQSVIEHKKNKRPITLTFHRAIDNAKDPLELFKQLLTVDGVDFVLTSGGGTLAGKAFDHLATINAMVKLAEKSKMRVIAGSGLSPDNIRHLIKATGVEQVHLGSGVRENGVLNDKKFTKLKSEIALASSSITESLVAFSGRYQSSSSSASLMGDSHHDVKVGVTLNK